MQTAAVGSTVPDLYGVMLPTRKRRTFPFQREQDDVISWGPINVVITLLFHLAYIRIHSVYKSRVRILLNLEAPLDLLGLDL